MPEQWPGGFVVELAGAMVGQGPPQEGHGAPSPPAATGKLDLGYLFIPDAWGDWYATEACAAAPDWLGGMVPGEPVVLTTQSAHVASMRLAAKLGFTEVERFEVWGAAQRLGTRSPFAARERPGRG